MDNDRIQGTAHQAKGSVKEAAGGAVDAARDALHK